MGESYFTAAAVTFGVAILLLVLGQANPDRWAKLGWFGVALLAVAFAFIWLAITAA